MIDGKGNTAVTSSMWCGRWAIAILADEAVRGRYTAAVTDPSLVLPYLAFAACCVAVVLFATRIPRGTS